MSFRDIPDTVRPSADGERDLLAPHVFRNGDVETVQDRNDGGFSKIANLGDQVAGGGVPSREVDTRLLSDETAAGSCTPDSCRLAVARMLAGQARAGRR